MSNLLEVCIVYKELNNHHFVIAVFPSMLKAKKYVARFYRGDTTILIQPVPFNPKNEVSFSSNCYPWSVES